MSPYPDRNNYGPVDAEYTPEDRELHEDARRDARRWQRLTGYALLSLGLLGAVVGAYLILTGAP